MRKKLKKRALAKQKKKGAGKEGELKAEEWEKTRNGERVRKTSFHAGHIALSCVGYNH